ncbi:MAG: RdgB/HAM1 family non-canonical purine NTP pyrophosphatase [Opitutaceae bacterium]|nr:RdgB/HAM1 family non-canonical purine NTP pyrophosphatase [Opitutaceae bacterium]
MNIYLASGNANKAKEIGLLLAAKALEVTLESAALVGGMPFVEEDKDSFEGNARKKAEALLELIPEDSWALADDSGLCVECLHGAPGVKSARFSGENATDETNNEKLLTLMHGNSPETRRAAFKCVLVLLGPGGQEHVFMGECQGSITLEKKGSSGFGYDPLFQPDGYSRTFAQLGLEVKNRISHRSNALRELLQWLRADARGPKEKNSFM